MITPYAGYANVFQVRLLFQRDVSSVLDELIRKLTLNLFALHNTIRSI